MFLENIFKNILDMSITASYVAIVVIIIRFILKKAPKNFSFVLWIAVLFRLVCPISFMSKLSIFNFINKNSFRKVNEISNNMIINSNISDTGFRQILNRNVSEYTVNNLSSNNLNILQGFENNFMEIATILWVIGIQILIIYFIVSYINTYSKIKTATLYKENVFESDQIDTAFVFGLFKPRVYIPVNITEKEKIYIIEHEKVHLRRKDYLIKVIAFLLLTIHWFNPIIWISFILMSKDMEMSCDEKVMKNLGEEIKMDYSHSLLNLAINRGNTFNVPISFSENNIKSRIKNILKYKKPKKSVVLIVAAIIVASTVFLISNPKNDGLYNKNNNSLYGESKYGKYINERYGFSIDIPEGWELNSDEKTKEANVNEYGEELDDNTVEKTIDEYTLRMMFPINTKDKIIVIKKYNLAITEAVSITIKNGNDLDKFTEEVNEIFNDNKGKISNKKINGKNTKVIEYHNSIVYLIKLNENKILNITSTYADESEDKILNMFDSISFK